MLLSIVMRVLLFIVLCFYWTGRIEASQPNWPVMAEQLSAKLSRALERDSQIDGLLGPRLTELFLQTALAFYFDGKHAVASRLIAQVIHHAWNPKWAKAAEKFMRYLEHPDIIRL